MLPVISDIQEAASQSVEKLYDIKLEPGDFNVQETRKEFEGDFTLVIFPLMRYKLGSPAEVGDRIGEALRDKLEHITAYNVIKGFLNLSLSDTFWLNFLAATYEDDRFLTLDKGKGQTVVVEYCSPNTNKPLHLGHLRNIILGDSLTRLLEANGFKAIATCLFNDRGTNISKSMYAWMQAGAQDTPESTGKKGDKFVGDYYVEYARQYKREVSELVEQGMDEKAAKEQAASNQAIRQLTVKWEAEDSEVRALWKKMNGWVYESMERTFERLGISFDTCYYESKVYLKGKETVEEELEKGIFYRKPDGSIWIDLSDEGLDEKLVLRKDGTSIYITQDLAIADAKYEQFQMDRSIYVVGNEQEYHFNVLFSILKKLGKPYAEGLFHLSYGMVDLPSGKMKSREGTTVEADDLMDQMDETAKTVTQELGKTEGMNEAELNKLYRTIGMGALKYFLVKVDPKKRILFNPAESVDIHGHTGPFIQYAYTRTAAIRRKADEIAPFRPEMVPESKVHEHERLLLRKLYQYPQVLAEAGEQYNPAMIANYVYELARDYNRFYHGDKIVQLEQPATSSYRLALSSFTGKVLESAMYLLGIEMPERM